MGPEALSYPAPTMARMGHIYTGCNRNAVDGRWHCGELRSWYQAEDDTWFRAS